MTNRPCSKCIWETTDGCMSWECEPITREEVKKRLKHGKWMPIYIEVYDGSPEGSVMQSGFYCSECNEEYQDDTSYCPNCGAAMESDR